MFEESRGALNQKAPVVEPTLTLRPEGAVTLSPSKAEPPFPITSWERYQAVRFLGQGGMGQVFLAYDLQLRRHVALKFVIGEDAELIRRLLAEACAQARVEHERVCQVHEVGEVQGKPYISMQFVNGVSLGQLAPTLTLEQKVVALRDAAEGVHAAHRVGLIHRDIKPSNILVERTEDGRLKPYVMDFGLAHDWRQKGTTATGAVLGTPHYMAPEQARGEVGQLDRRADVYSLGATLYTLITGQPPISGSNGLEVVNNISRVEPPRPRLLNPDTPVELEAIILKCLEKERSARYPSARALIEDLDRFLAGEPVRARSTGLWYRLRKKAIKHRLVVSVAALAWLAVTVALGWVAYTHRRAVEREALVRGFTERVERIEALARYSGLSPLHDTRPEREAIRAAMVKLGEDIERVQLEVGPKSYALGRGYLALGDLERAHEHLEAAWRSGFREPRFAYTRALVLGRLYQARVLEAERLEGAARRDLKERLQRELREPLLEALELSLGAADVPPAYVHALIAFHEEKPCEALTQLDRIEHSWSWFHEVPLLRGDIRRARAILLWQKGDLEGARGFFAASRKAYAMAADLGKSVLTVYLAQAELEQSELLMEIQVGGFVHESFERGIQAVEHAHRIAPDEPAVYLLRARMYRHLAEYQLSQEADAESSIEGAVIAARTALNLLSNSARPRPELKAQIQRELERCLTLQS
ncbi:MAG TPA: protein kinase [Myxococcaceae bacterium]|jgi:serine/threonine-protein kinase